MFARPAQRNQRQWTGRTRAHLPRHPSPRSARRSRHRCYLPGPATRLSPLRSVSLQSAFCVAHHSRMVLTLSSASRRVLSGILGRSRDLKGSLMLGIFGDRGVFQIAEEKGRPHVLQMVNSASTSQDKLRRTSTAIILTMTKSLPTMSMWMVTNIR
jgi:hypothetical protein